ncbi:MAG: hypothetical protein V3U46_03170 [Acidimicrobiia bacterium]
MGIVSDEARQIAADHGLIFVGDICIAVTRALLEIPSRARVLENSCVSLCARLAGCGTRIHRSTTQ